jgi:hypothetical protein
MAKPMLVTAPFLLLLLDFWPLERWDRKSRTEGGAGVTHRALLLEKVPFILLALLTGAATWLAQSRAGALAVASTFAPGQRVANALVSGARYLGDTVWPARLAVFYPHPSSIGERVPAAAWLSSPC